MIAIPAPLTSSDDFEDPRVQTLPPVDFPIIDQQWSSAKIKFCNISTFLFCYTSIKLYYFLHINFTNSKKLHVQKRNVPILENVGLTM